jgi:hypothetical protein
MMRRIPRRLGHILRTGNSLYQGSGQAISREVSEYEPAATNGTDLPVWITTRRLDDDQLPSKRS